MNEQEMLEKAKSHIEKNNVNAVIGRKCVDGGYRPDQSPGMIARTGGDLGYVMALMLLNKEKNLDLSPTQCFDVIYDAVTKSGDKFYMHTDQHASARHSPAQRDEGGQHNIPLIGCGHALKSTLPENAAKYGLDVKDMEEMIKYANSKAESGQNIVNIHLDREHQEQGVLLIKDTDMTVNPWDEENGTMFFVYDETRDNEFMKELVESVETYHGTSLQYDDFKAASDRQLNATLEILAKGKPVFEVSNLASDNPTVKVLKYI